METATVAPALVYASPGRRLFAAFLDNVVVSLIATTFAQGAWRRFGDALFDGKTPANGDVAQLTVAFLLTIVIYSTALHAWRGSTFGKMAARTVLVNDDGTKVTPAAAFVRAVTLGAIFFASTFAASIPMVLSELRPIWHRRRQTWHDTVARTVVVRADSLPPQTDPDRQ